MAKALLGYVGGEDPRQAQVTWQLRTRVKDLEAEVLRLKTENDQLSAAYRQVRDELTTAVADDLSALADSETLLEPVAR